MIQIFEVFPKPGRIYHEDDHEPVTYSIPFSKITPHKKLEFFFLKKYLNYMLFDYDEKLFHSKKGKARR